MPFDLNAVKPVLLGLFFMENGDDLLETEGVAGSLAFCTFTDARTELIGVRDLGVTPSSIPLFLRLLRVCE